MIFLSNKKPVIKFFAILSSFLLIFYSVEASFLLQIKPRPILAQEVDEDAAQEAAEAAREAEETAQETAQVAAEEAAEAALEKEEEVREKAEEEAEEKQDFDEKLYEDYVEKYEDIFGWKPIPINEYLNQYYGITPTPTPTPQPTTTPLSNQQPNNAQGEGSQSTTRENTDDSIFIENYNHDTTLEQNIYTEANTGGNVVSQDAPPAEESSPETPPNSQPGPTLSCPPPPPEENGFEEGESGESDFIEGEDGQTVDASGENQNVGDDSETRIETTNNDETRVTNKNCVEVQTDNTAAANTGNNTQLDNEGSAQMETGPGEASGRTEVYGNINETETQGSGQAEAENTNTGDDSTNVNVAQESETLIVENENHMAAQNNLSVSAESGENQLVNNEDEATLITGPLDLMAALLNILNLNITGEDFEFLLINIFGQFTGEVDLDDIAEEHLNMSEEELEAIAVNYRTGEDSENEAEAVNHELLDVSNNNQAQVQNNLAVSGVSGRNELSENEDPVNLLTGRIKIVAAILNLINTNLTGTDWLFAMINIFGTLEGDIILPDPNDFLVGPGGAEASNSESGSGSTSVADATDTSDIAVTNDNQATVVNNIDARGDSGRNQSLANEDETNLETQDVNVVTNVIDWLDVNIFGNRFVLLIVNVMGRWLGNVIAFPGRGNIAPPEEGILVAAASGASSGPEVVAQNQQVGNDSINTAVATSETVWEVDNQNVAVVENNVDVDAVSGQNNTNLNEDPITVTTGWIDINVDLLNIINLNVTGRDWLLVMVNIFGDFLGNLVFPHQESLSQEPSGGESEADFQEEIPPAQEQNGVAQGYIPGQENSGDDNNDESYEDQSNVGGSGEDQSASDDSDSSASSGSQANNSSTTKNTPPLTVEIAANLEEEPKENYGEENFVSDYDSGQNIASGENIVKVLGLAVLRPVRDEITFYIIFAIGLIAFYIWTNKRLDKLI